MLITREEYEHIEDTTLAPYGMRSRHSRGRRFPEEEAPYRTAFQRDRDRILHNTAFRRLEYKTQVFVIHEGDHYRTRLTHTLEVAQIGRTMARALGANEDLVEAVCLAHDLGHPAFGHAGETTLNRLMQGHGGFDHNRQSLRIVDKLAVHYPEFRGLNLTWEVREGMVKHETEYDVSDASDFEPEKRCSLEGQLANPADEIAYTAHDLDDGLRSGLLRAAQLAGIAWWERLKESLSWDGTAFDDLLRSQLTRRLIGLLVTDLIESTSQRLEQCACTSVEAVRNQPQKVVGLSPEIADRTRELKRFLYEHLYRHPHVIRMQLKAERVITALFEAYVGEPAQLPYEVQGKLQERPLERVVCDYIAGMTDRYALQEFTKLFDPLTAV